VSLIRPDFGKWKPLKPKNQLLMAIEHGFAEPTAKNEEKDKNVIGIDNIVNESFCIFNYFYIYFYAFFEF
jgi:hypothetical protein